MDQLFQQSRLLREKWDEVHYADGSTYGEKTIERAVMNTSESYTPESREGSAQTSTTIVKSSVVTGNDSERTHAYVTEKNRLLTERVAELEATLDQKDERIATLEAEVDRLKTELADCGREANYTHKEQAVSTRTDDEVVEITSVWDQTKQLFQRGFE